MSGITYQDAPAASAEDKRGTEPDGAAANNDHVEATNSHIPPRY